MSRRVFTGAALVAAALVAAGVLFFPLGAVPPTGWTVVGWNNLGMHCLDADFSVFATLPPYNTIQAHLIDPTGKLVTSATGVAVTYEAVADPTGSINTTSAGKTNFWDNVQSLFGVTLAVNAGLKGKNMPGAGNPPQPMTFDPSLNWFIAEGIPLTPYDDTLKKNTYPLMRIRARDASGNLLASTDIVLPVSDEMDCSSCHASGSKPAALPSSGWVFDPNPQRDYRRNIIRLHDDRNIANPVYLAALSAAGYNSAGLTQSVEVDKKAVLCANCHLSEALAGSGLAGISQLTTAIHRRHSGVIDPTNGLALDATANRSACYRCHPGSTTRCLRGAMGAAVAADGTLSMQCQSCHGLMSAVGSPARTGWLDEPSCGNCHTGTAVTNSGQIRFTSALLASGARRAPADPTFTTNPNTPAAGFSLYRFSKGHGGLQCSACHGSTHAEFPAAHPNDNLQSIALQGHVGTIAECATCHNTSPVTTNGGPHGMHPVGAPWVGAHANAAESNRAPCQACHGTDYRGTVLSRSFANRTLSTSFGTKVFWRGFTVGCYTCHNGPSSESSNPNRAPVVQNLSVTTPAGAPVAIALLATDPDGNVLTLRIVSQPANGTVGLVGTVATYFPAAGFSGTETFTYAASDGMTESNLGTVTVTVGSGTPPTPTPTATSTPIGTATPTPVSTATPTARPTGTPTPGPSATPTVRPTPTPTPRPTATPTVRPTPTPTPRPTRTPTPRGGDD